MKIGGLYMQGYGEISAGMDEYNKIVNLAKQNMVNAETAYESVLYTIVVANSLAEVLAAKLQAVEAEIDKLGDSIEDSSNAQALLSLRDRKQNTRISLMSQIEVLGMVKSIVLEDYEDNILLGEEFDIDE